MIELKNINLKFKDKIIFEDFCFSVNNKEKVLLFAPSGQGKTSLFNMMQGFLKPESGIIKIAGQLLQKNTIDIIRKNICYIGQDTSLQSGNVADVISEIGAFTVNKHKDFTHERICELFKQFSLSEKTLEKTVETLSGGERQRLAFILCILMDRQIWLLDEITGGLDKKRKNYIIEYIAACDKTVVVISHDIAWHNEKIRRVSW